MKNYFLLLACIWKYGTVQVKTDQAFLAQINLYALNKGTDKVKLELQLTVLRTGFNYWFFFDLEPNGQYVSCSTQKFSINPGFAGTDNPVLQLSANNDTELKDIDVLIGGCSSCPDYAWELILNPFNR